MGSEDLLIQSTAHSFDLVAGSASNLLAVNGCS